MTISLKYQVSTISRSKIIFKKLPYFYAGTNIQTNRQDLMCRLTCSVSTKDQFFSNMSSKESATLRRNRQNNLKKKILLPLVFSYIFLNGKLYHSTSEAHSLPSQIPKLELFAKMFEGDLNTSLLSSVILKYNFINCNYSN